MKFKQFLPNGMKTYRAALWKASCIVGWTTAFLGVVRIVPDEDEKEARYMGKRQDKKIGWPVQQLLLTVAQAAVVLGVHRSAVYDLIKYEGLPMVSLGGRRGTRILLTSLHQWMKKRESCSTR